MAVNVGLDLGSYAVKVVALRKKGQSFLVENLGVAYNPVGQFLPKEETQLKQLAVTIKNLLNEQKLSGKGVLLSLPESDVFTTIVSMPILTDAELSSAIQWEAEQHLPVSLDEVNLEYAVLYRPKKGSGEDRMKILLVAAKKDTIARMMSLMNGVGVEIVGLETTLLAISRSFGRNSVQDGSKLVCHIGALSVDIAVLNKGVLELTHMLPTGGLALTRAVEKGLGLDPSQAEEYKRTYGLDETQLEGKVRNAMLPVFNTIVSEVRKTVQYFKSENLDTPIKGMILSGGGAYLPGLISSMANSLSVEVVVGNPLENLSVAKNVRLPKDTASFSVAVGLAMREEE